MATLKKTDHTVKEHTVKFELVFQKNDPVKSVLEKIKKDPLSWANAENVIVVDSENTFLGTAELKTLLASDGNIKLENLVSENYPFVKTTSHQSHIARVALEHGSENIPVVDEKNKFIGIIDATQILKILHEEHIEKLMHFSGILNNESLLEGYKAKIMHVVKSRLPWLFLGLFGGAMSTFLIRSYSVTLQAELALAFFIPVIVYMNSAVGTQAQTIFVRYSTLEKVHLVKSLLFEIKVAFFIGLTLSGLIFIFTGIIVGIKIAFVVGISMFLGILSSAFTGTLIPWILEKKGKDPAIGSGPFTTIIQDLLSISIYFSIASAVL